MHRKSKLFILLILGILFNCQLKKQEGPSVETGFSSEVPTKEIGCPISLSLGTVYGTSLSKFDQTYLLSVLKVLLGDLCVRSFSHLPSLIHPEKGLFVDAKGYWTLLEVEKDLASPNGYFEIYYFDSKKLDHKKGSMGNLTVREVFLSAKKVWADFYVGSSEEVEVRFRFAENPKLERYLINPSFIKWEGKWYLLRMF
ncbi:hypothetical protein ACO2KH_14400 [Leptospira terpstrae]|uniref:hypothetical protein n=1 Tax=Leptospira terpstrae TaxID=293075 RepID=UPI003CFE5C22